MSDNVLVEIDGFIESLQEDLWPLNDFIHKNPELAFEEHKSHDALTNYMQSHEDWQITCSAYGLDTAWVALYDSGKQGPVVSFNAEMGMSLTVLRKNANVC
jgi:metal-dependent amidase/aminoacylase/carboxypeptidase family protein